MYFLNIFNYKFWFQKFIASLSSVIGSIWYPLSFNTIIICSNASTVCFFSCINKTKSSLFLPFNRTLLIILSVVDFQSSVSKFQSHNKNPFSTNILYDSSGVYGLLPYGILIKFDVSPVISLNVSLHVENSSNVDFGVLYNVFTSWLTLWNPTPCPSCYILITWSLYALMFLFIIKKVALTLFLSNISNISSVYFDGPSSIVI